MEFTSASGANMWSCLRPATIVTATRMSASNLCMKGKVRVLSVSSIFRLCLKIAKMQETDHNFIQTWPTLRPCTLLSKLQSRPSMPVLPGSTTKKAQPTPRSSTFQFASPPCPKAPHIEAEHSSF